MKGAAIEDRESGDIEIPWKMLGKKTINGGEGKKKGEKSKRKEEGGGQHELGQG